MLQISSAIASLFGKNICPTETGTQMPRFIAIGLPEMNSNYTLEYDAIIQASRYIKFKIEVLRSPTTCETVSVDIPEFLIDPEIFDSVLRWVTEDQSEQKICDYLDAMPHDTVFHQIDALCQQYKVAEKLVMPKLQLQLVRVMQVFGTFSATPRSWMLPNPFNSARLPTYGTIGAYLYYHIIEAHTATQDLTNEEDCLLIRLLASRLESDMPVRHAIARNDYKAKVSQLLAKNQIDPDELPHRFDDYERKHKLPRASH